MSESLEGTKDLSCRGLGDSNQIIILGYTSPGSEGAVFTLGAEVSFLSLLEIKW